MSISPLVQQAEEYLRANKLPQAEELVRKVLDNNPQDVVAIRLLANIGVRLRRYDDACIFLERCLELAPDYHLARQNYVAALMRRQKLDMALDHVNLLLRADPDNIDYMLLKTSVLIRRGDFKEVVSLFETIFEFDDNLPRPLIAYGHALKSLGEQDKAVTAYKRALSLDENIWEAYWSLANLKVFKFTDAEVQEMERLVDSNKASNLNKSYLGFSLGKAYEDRQEYGKSFYYYQQANQCRAADEPYDRHEIDTAVTAHKEYFNKEFKSSNNEGRGKQDIPIFIVGMPRAGSTLIEQIISSHSQVEATSELVDIMLMAYRLGGNPAAGKMHKYLEVLTQLDEQKLSRLGESYLKSTVVYRSGSPYFIDKMPNNFMHIGLIKMILPNAKIIDARRDPMACCFAGYKQFFASGQSFTNSLDSVGHYYRRYVELMQHWQQVFPGEILTVNYEDVVNKPEEQISLILDYCGLSFEEQCLRFYENKRVIRTPSSEQVRQPIYTKGLEQWKNYEEYLSPLKNELNNA